LEGNVRCIRRVGGSQKIVKKKKKTKFEGGVKARDWVILNRRGQTKLSPHHNEETA